MQVNANITSIYNISKAQEVSANNIANVNTDGFKASKAIQHGDTVTISQDARTAVTNATGIAMSTTAPAQDIISMTINQTALEANIKAIQTQDDMSKALLTIKGSQV